jgi:hypothetical protein
MDIIYITGHWTFAGSVRLIRPGTWGDGPSEGKIIIIISPLLGRVKFFRIPFPCVLHYIAP